MKLVCYHIGLKTVDMCLKQDMGEYFELREEIQQAGGNCVTNVMGLVLMVGTKWV